jgi:hypothetical protein
VCVFECAREREREVETGEHARGRLFVAIPMVMRRKESNHSQPVLVDSALNGRRVRHVHNDRFLGLRRREDASEFEVQVERDGAEVSVTNHTQGVQTKIAPLPHQPHSKPSSCSCRRAPQGEELSNLRRSGSVATQKRDQACERESESARGLPFGQFTRSCAQQQ